MASNTYMASPGSGFAKTLAVMRVVGCVTLGLMLAGSSLLDAFDGDRALTAVLGVLLLASGLAASMATGRPAFWIGTAGCAIAGFSTYFVQGLALHDSLADPYYLCGIALTFVMAGSLMQFADYKYRR